MPNPTAYVRLRKTPWSAQPHRLACLPGVPNPKDYDVRSRIIDCRILLLTFCSCCALKSYFIQGTTSHRAGDRPICPLRMHSNCKHSWAIVQAKHVTSIAKVQAVSKSPGKLGAAEAPAQSVQSHASPAGAAALSLYIGPYKRWGISMRCRFLHTATRRIRRHHWALGHSLYTEYSVLELSQFTAHYVQECATG